MKTSTAHVLLKTRLLLMTPTRREPSSKFADAEMEPEKTRTLYGFWAQHLLRWAPEDMARSPLRAVASLLAHASREASGRAGWGTCQAMHMCRLASLKVSQKLEAGTGAVEPRLGEVWVSRSSAGDREGAAGRPPASPAPAMDASERVWRNPTLGRLQAPITSFSKWGWTETGSEVDRLGAIILQEGLPALHTDQALRPRGLMSQPPLSAP